MTKKAVLDLLIRPITNSLQSILVLLDGGQDSLMYWGNPIDFTQHHPFPSYFSTFLT